MATGPTRQPHLHAGTSEGPRHYTPAPHSRSLGPCAASSRPCCTTTCVWRAVRWQGRNPAHGLRSRPPPHRDASTFLPSPPPPAAATVPHGNQARSGSVAFTALCVLYATIHTQASATHTRGSTATPARRIAGCSRPVHGSTWTDTSHGKARRTPGPDPSAAAAGACGGCGSETQSAPRDTTAGRTDLVADDREQ